MKADNNNRIVEINSLSDEMRQQMVAEIFCTPTINAARVIMDSNKNQSLDINAIARFLDKQTEAIQSGNLEQVEAMLLQQAYTLQALFLTMSARMVNADYQNAKQLYGNLAFKAQAQCRQSLQALVELKHPRQNTVINNKAHNQQVNYHEAGLAALEEHEAATMTNELLSEAIHETMDRSGTSAASRNDSDLAALA